MAQKNYVGFVSEVSSTPWNDRDTGNEITLYSFKIDTANIWFRTGETDTNLSVGDCVKFTANRQKVDLGTLGPAQASEVESAPKPGAQAATPAGAKSSAGGSMSRDGYWKEKDRYDKEVRQPMIAYQSARKDATAIVVAALQQDCLALGQKKAAKLELLMGFVEEVTQEYYKKYVEMEESING
jgi:hypothetical protein